MHCTHGQRFGDHLHHGCHGTSGYHGGGGCCLTGFETRRFFTKDENVQHFEQYLEQLRNEVKGVEEYINELKKAEN